ncbi:MAG: fatty acid desaturase family protein [Limisphaerales bacterium]
MKQDALVWKDAPAARFPDFSVAPLTDKERKEKIRELHKQKPVYNGIILIFFAIWAAAGWLILQMPNVWLKLPGYFLIGVVLHSLAILMHEGLHGKLFKEKKLNRWIGFFCGAPALVGLSAYKSVHLYHHRHERGIEDPDEFENLTRQPPLLKTFLLVWFFVGAYLYIIHIPATGLKLGSRLERKKIVEEYVLLIGLIVLAFLVVPFDILAQVWLLPILFTAQLSQVRGLAEHVFTAGDEPLRATRTVHSSALVRFFMCNMNYHLEHHIYPGVPWYNSRRLHFLLADDIRKAGGSIYSSYLVYLWDVGKALFSKVTNPYAQTGPPAGYYPHYMPVLTGSGAPINTAASSKSNQTTGR